MQRTLVIGILTFSSPQAAFGAETTPPILALKDVLGRVKANNARLRAAEAGIEEARGRQQRAWTAWQPTIDAVGQLTLNSVRAQFDTAGLIQGVATALDLPVPADLASRLPPPIEIQPNVQWAGVLLARQTLFDIAALRAPGVAAKGTRAAELGAEAVEDEVLYRAARLYAGLVGLAELEAASTRAITVAERRIQEAEAQLEAGTATQLAVTRAETDRIVAEGQRLGLRQQQRSAMAALGALMGTDGAFEVTSAPFEESISIAASGGVEDQSAIKARRASLEAAQAAVGLHELRWLPRLAADGTLRYSNVEGFSGDRFLATATVNLVIPLYDSGARYADRRIAEAQALAAEKNLEAARREAAAVLEEAASRVVTAQAELEQAQAQLKLATEAVAQVEALAANGLSTSLDLTDADSKRFAADRLVVQRTFDLAIARLSVAEAKGAKLL